MKFIFLTGGLMIGTAMWSSPAIAQAPALLLTDGQQLARVKGSASRDTFFSRQLSALLGEADELLNMKPVSVMDKAFTPVSGNKHDYMSQAPYFWYDSSKPNGKPYLRRDGVRNPEINRITDRSYLGKLDHATRVLSLAWYFSNDEKYARQASRLLRTWFLDTATKMNPNLDYGQAIPGINDGRGIGIIETIALTGIADAALLLTTANAWTKADHQALQQWYRDYLRWMLTSKNGREEYAAKNNHGTWFYVQAVDFALFCGDKAQARKLATESKKRLNSQLHSDGAQPLELERTKGLAYSTYNLQGWFVLAGLARRVDVDLWNYRTPNGAGLQKAFDWLAPYALGERPWTYQQIGGYKKEEFFYLLSQAATVWKAPAYVTQAREMVHSIRDPAGVLSQSSGL